MLRSPLLLALVLVASTLGAQQDSGFEPGRDYNRLTPTQPTSSPPEQVEVAEVFWYGCPHCYNFDSYLSEWESSKAEYVSFVRIPAVWNPLLRVHAQAFYTAQVLGKGAEMHEPLFAEIHENSNYLDTPEKLANFFARFGVSRETFEETFNSREVNMLLQKAEELNQRYQISSVPTIVINGKYTSNASMTGSYERLIELMDTLAASEHRAQSQ
ncbi:MAG: thiol:disulfide interchange protein DsbA/DsbL [Gammaproteobacteria bacterium]|jgi:thiol:disulfide interchange protein DsbA